LTYFKYPLYLYLFTVHLATPTYNTKYIHCFINVFSNSIFFLALTIPFLMICISKSLITILLWSTIYSNSCSVYLKYIVTHCQINITFLISIFFLSNKNQLAYSTNLYQLSSKYKYYCYNTILFIKIINMSSIYLILKHSTN